MTMLITPRTALRPRPEDAPADGTSVRRWAGGFGVAAGLLLVMAMPPYVMRGTPPPLEDAVAFAAYMARNNINVLTGVMVDTLYAACFVGFLAGLAALDRQSRHESGWLATVDQASHPEAGGRDFLQAVVAGGDASRGWYLYISSLAGITYLIWPLSAALSLFATGPRQQGEHVSRSGTGG